MAGSRFAGNSRYSGGSRFAQGSRFAGAERGGGADISATLPVLEQEAKAAGAPLPAQDSPGLFSRIADIISRPNYAVAGAAEELFSPQGKAQGVGHRGIAALKRAGTELFSGVGDLHGQKEGFGQVMEQAGVPALGHFSDIVPSIPVHTGFGNVMSVPIAGSPLDVTGRGAVGLGLDIVADPTTELGFGVIGKSGKVGSGFLTKTGGKLLAKETLAATENLSTRVAAIKALKAADATVTSSAANTLIGRGTTAAPVLRDLAIKEAKDRVEAAIAGGAKGLLDKGGIKWAGIHIADSPLSAIANSGVSKDLVAKLAPTLPGRAVLASTAWTKKNLVDPLGNLFVKGYGIKGLEGARGVMDDAINKEAFLKNLAQEDIAKSPFAPWLNKSEKEIEATFRPVVDAYQTGGIAAVPTEFKPAMTYYAQKVDQMYQEEVKSGLLQRERKLVNYFAHYYKNDPEDLARVIYKQKGGLSGVQGEVNRLLRLGRNAEERVYDTLAEAESYSKKLNAQNKSIPILEAVYNPIDSLTRRWEHSITKRVNREMTTALEAAHGPLPIKDVYDLATPVQYGINATRKKAIVDHILDVVPSDGKLKAVAKLTDDAKKTFFLERFKRIGSREEAAAVVTKYDQFQQFWPKRLVQADTDFAADGSRFIEFNPGQGSKYSVTLPETLANEVAGMSDHIVQSKGGRKLLQGFDTVNNFWKGSVTWLFPSFHVRNAYSNVAQSFVDIGMHAINPESYRETASILFGKGAGTFKTALGTYSYDEVRQILNRHGINTSARAIAEFTGGAESKILKPFAKAREAGTAIENESRAQLALNYLRRGMDPEEVGARVNKFQLDYSKGLTNFERQWMKRIIPFYSFQRLNLGLQLENMVKRPGMLAAELKPFRGREDENAQLTSWDAGALKIRLNRDGKSVQMITGIDLPIRNLDLLFRGNLKDTFANAVGMLTPILKVPIEVAANKSLFTGNEFNRTNVPAAGRIVEQMPASVQQWMGYKKTFDTAGRPQYSMDAQRYYLVGQAYATSRILSTADRQWREYIDNADGNHLQSLLDLTTGLRFSTKDLDEEKAKRSVERKKDLEQALIRWGQRQEYRKTYKRAGQ